MARSFLFYAQAVDSRMLVALSAILSDQATPTKATMEKAKLFLDCAASHPDAILTYNASNMVMSFRRDSS